MHNHNYRVHIIELSWWRSSCTDFIRAEMLIGRLVGSPVGVSGWGWEWVRWAVGRWLLHFFWTRQPSRARAKPKPNRVPFDKRGLLRSAKLCQMCPSCTCCYLTLPDHPQPSHSPHPPSNNQGTVGVISPLATDREVSKSQYVIILSIFIFPIFSRALQIRHGIYYIGGLKSTN